MDIGILGAGTWGCALAVMLAKSGHNVTVWSALKEEIESLTKTRKHKNLPNMDIPDSLDFTADIKSACESKNIIVFAVPSVFVRSTAEAAEPFIKNGQIIADVAKGIEPHTLYTMTGIIHDVLKDNVRLVALSGPTHAEEVAVGLPTTIVSASKDIDAAKYVQSAFMNDNMRVYINSDILGVELCGALKNIIALASGISSGLGNGDNTTAAIITRGMVEITRLGTSMGCNSSTFYGLAGIGDLIVTATSRHSRNNRAGRLIGEGLSPQKAKDAVGMVVEGINALPAAMELATKYNTEMPITAAVNSIIFNNADPAATMLELMRRDKKIEDTF
ncbi:MAG: NAD(P)-dependent glycerol-3-phosphate dehydrogenase [Clostridiales bacterium]|nr:NAD(P)-dependent glycerol-3-phosphate dehydrogenase [Clostridiales bacterium]